MPIKNRNGFTLVELLVVITIIVILASLLLPALNKSRQRANIINCASNLKQFALAYQMFAQDHYENFPAGPSELYGISGSKSIYPDYLNNAHVFWCPSDLKHTAQTAITASNYDDSYQYVFSLKVANNAVVPIPMVSDWCQWNTVPATPRFESNHVQGANTLYMDGSVRWVDYTASTLDASFFSTTASPGKVAGKNDGVFVDTPLATAWGQ